MGADAFDVPRGTCPVLKTCRYSGEAVRRAFGFTATVGYVRSLSLALFLSAIPPLRFPVSRLSRLASVSPCVSHKSRAISAVLSDMTVVGDPVKGRVVLKGRTNKSNVNAFGEAVEVKVDAFTLFHAM